MKKTIYLFAAVMTVCGAAAQTATSKDPLDTARRLYAAGQWEAAEYEFDRAAGQVRDLTPFGRISTEGEAATVAAVESQALMEAETFAALAAARRGVPGAGERLEAVLERYPASPWTGQLRFRAGVVRHDAGEYDRALEMLAGVLPRRLSKDDRDEFYFLRGHSLFVAGAREDARADLAMVARGGEWGSHAAYYTAYMDYSEGNHAAAKPVFASLAGDPSYSALMPYYLLQIEFNEGNWRYVADNAGKLAEQTTMARRAEIAGMAAQSWFHLGEYDRALANMEDFSRMGGTMSRQEHYTAGFSFYRAGRYEDAARHLALATGADDGLSQNASYHLADVYLHLRDPQRAMQSFSIAAASGADAAIAEDALFNYGKLLFETGGGRFNEAINVLTRYIATYPGSSQRTREARGLLIAAYYNSNDYEAAYEAIRSHPDPDNEVRAALQKITYFRALERWREGDAEVAMAMLEESARNRYNAKYTALAAFWQGEILYSQGRYEAAMPQYEEYVRLSPATETENRLARYNLGYANFNLERWSAARRWFDDFLTRHSTRDAYRADAFNRAGDIQHAGRDYWAAIESYDAAAAVGTPERFYSAYQRAMMLGLVDRPERKIESLQAIITAGQGDYVEQATYELGRYYISRDGYADGARVLGGFIERYPASGLYLPALSNLALAYLNMGDRERSMQYYKAIVERAPFSREAQDAMVGIRGLYVDRGDVEGYFAYARAAGAPTDVGEAQRDSLTFAAAERIYLSGDADRAIPALEGYVAGDARGQYIPTAVGYLSGLYAAAGRWSEAADAYRRGATLATDAAVRSRALEGYVASVIATGDGARIKAMADEVAASEETPTRSRLDAAFAKAGVLRAEGANDEALGIYTTLAVDPSTAAGAESAYRVIEYLYGQGEFRRAEEAVFALSQSGTPHSYWLGESFLTLGDIYVREGDTFQARATFQSIVDGYSPADDGILAAARERIANLK
ncbi:MAG: tetratricopeptide repeat protein [Alistipes sp.]|jgi:TolA-binding protein|nr:tetratricopeptide repeat protein [Alistipes sp.]